MKHANLWFIVLILSISCSTGKKALQKGNYFSAVTKAVERLKSDPNNEKAMEVLTDGYPMAIEWAQEEMDFTLSANQAFKWENAINLMNQVNRLSELIRSTPAARKIVTNPKSYSSELNMAFEKAAEERYLAGEQLLAENSRESARAAFDHFLKADQLIPGYKNAVEKLDTAKDLATLKVIVEAITVHTKKYQLSSEFFYNQVFEFLNNKFPRKSFVNIFSPKEAEAFGIEQPDFVVRMEFYDFSVGNLTRHEKEEELTKRVKLETKDTLRVQYKTYKAKLKTYTDEVVSGGQLEYKIIDFQDNALVKNTLIPGSFTWINQYAIFAGDVEALNKSQLELTHRKAMPLPPQQDLFIEFTKPIFDQLTAEMEQFFRWYR